MQTRSSPSLEFLTGLARHSSIVDVNSFSKQELFERLKQQVDIARASRAESRALRKSSFSSFPSSSCGASSSSSSSTSASSSSLLLVPGSFSSSVLGKRERGGANGAAQKKSLIKTATNKLDPIMFTPLRKKVVWHYTRPFSGQVVAFNVDSLIDFLLSTGDFTDPDTRVPFSDQDLKEIDALAVKAGLKKPSVYEKHNNPDAFKDMKFLRDAIQGLERCAGEVVADILELIENSDPHEAQVHLLMRELPAFADYYSQLRAADSLYAAQCLNHWKLFIRGPPNRPNTDDNGLIECVIHYLTLCADAGPMQFGMGGGGAGVGGFEEF